MPNNLQSYQIIFCTGFSCFLGTFLAYTANTFYQAHPERAKFDYARTLDFLLSCVAMGVLAGCSALAIGSTEPGYLESYSLASIFFYVFFLSLLIGATDTWLGMIKGLIRLIFSKVMPIKKPN